jgi:hypothetical protein
MGYLVTHSKGEYMARKTTAAPKITLQGLEREAANRAGGAKQEKARDARQANAEKQRRYRKNMKAQGYHAVLAWEKPIPPDMVKVSAIIHKSSLDIAGRKDTEAGQFIHHLYDEVLIGHQKRKISDDTYRDILSLLTPLGDSGL